MNVKRDRWNERYRQKELVWSAEPNAGLVAEVAGLEPATALDVACGEGRNAIWLAREGWQVSAVDFSDAGIDKGRQIAAREGVDVDWIVGDILDHDFAGKSFDLVVMLYVHTGADDREIWLPRMVDLVAPGGRLVYLGHDRSNIEHGIGGPQDPAVLPTPEEVVAILGDFEVEKAGVVERRVEQETGHGGAGTGVALDALVRARRKNP